MRAQACLCSCVAEVSAHDLVIHSRTAHPFLFFPLSWGSKRSTFEKVFARHSRMESLLLLWPALPIIMRHPPRLFGRHRTAGRSCYSFAESPSFSVAVLFRKSYLLGWRPAQIIGAFSFFPGIAHSLYCHVAAVGHPPSSAAVAVIFSSLGGVRRISWTGLGQPDERLRAREQERKVFWMA